MELKPWHRHYDYNVPTTVRVPRWPIHELIQIPANAYPDKAALNFYGTEMTFWELRQQILCMANALGALGVQKGERVGIHLPNCPQYVIAYYAALSLGAIVVNLNPMYTAEELKLMANLTDLTTLITFDMVLPTIRVLCKEVHIPQVIVTKVTDYIKGMGVSTVASLDLEKRMASFLNSDWGHPKPQTSPGPGKPGGDHRLLPGKVGCLQSTEAHRVPDFSSKIGDWKSSAEDPAGGGNHKEGKSHLGPLEPKDLYRNGHSYFPLCFPPANSSNLFTASSFIIWRGTQCWGAKVRM